MLCTGLIKMIVNFRHLRSDLAYFHLYILNIFMWSIDTGRTFQIQIQMWQNATCIVIFWTQQTETHGNQEASLTPPHFKCRDVISSDSFWWNTILILSITATHNLEQCGFLTLTITNYVVFGNDIVACLQDAVLMELCNYKYRLACDQYSVNNRQ